MILEHMSTSAKHAVDGLSYGALIGIFVANLPAMTALLIFVWTALRVYETWLKIRLARRKLAAKALAADDPAED